MKASFAVGSDPAPEFVAMKIVVTAGNTYTPIDQVRGITNIFTGRTGTAIALEGCRRGHGVVLLTSHPELTHSEPAAPGELEIRGYRSFRELEQLMPLSLQAGCDAFIHSAAVSDYQAGGIYAPAPDTHFQPDQRTWHAGGGKPPALVDRTAAKVKSNQPELWLRLIRTPKLIDKVRSAWGFEGILVKFKLEAGVAEAELLALVEPARQQSQADLLVANTLEGAQHWALLGPLQGHYAHVSRAELAARLLQAVEQLHEERRHG
jgi:phosphopantothenate---cysteine ligase (CTP)